MLVLCDRFVLRHFLNATMDIIAVVGPVAGRVRQVGLQPCHMLRESETEDAQQKGRETHGLPVEESLNIPEVLLVQLQLVKISSKLQTKW
jgi:hypothetical protein